MDTNSLTLIAHEILSLADRIDQALTLDIACMCSDFKDEDKYLNKVLHYLKKIKEDPEEFIEDWGLEEKLHPNSLKAQIIELEKYVADLLKVPFEKRGITYEEHEYEMPRNTHISDLTHFLDKNGEIAKSMPKEAREKASFFTLLIDKFTSSWKNELKTDIRCFQPGCDGHIFTRKNFQTHDIEWHCLMCGASGTITKWQGTKWDNSKCG